MIDLTDDNLNQMRRNTENNFVERKTVRDKGGWLRTAVGFANSAPVDYPAVLFVGVNDDGTLENVPPAHDWETQQKTVTEQLSRAYPPLYVLPKIIRDEQGQEFLAVIAPGSPQRPHFTGKAYIRVGPETKEASEKQFDILIAQRQSKPYEILGWKGKQITVDYIHPERAILSLGRVQSTEVLTVISCTSFYVTLQRGASEVSVALDRIGISFDTEN